MSRSASPRSATLYAAALLVLAAAGCPDSVGIVCPPGECDGDNLAVAAGDLSATVSDLAATRDLVTRDAPVDLAIGRDMVDCEAACQTGCCDAEGTCHPPSVASCGFKGRRCVACDTDRNDTCTSSGCNCGGSGTCDAGSHCAGGKCVCDKTSCLRGCCDDQDKCQPFALNFCASVPGGSCAGCDPRFSDGCAGNCTCGKGAPCAQGQRCAGGACVCDGQSCPSGCCHNDTCMPGTDPMVCGAGGNACMACAMGQICPKGACFSCNAQTCPDGCCSAMMCLTPSPSACGTGGIACAPCDKNNANKCDKGSCRCGANGPCGAGLACVNGACVCNQVSCANGCCLNNACVAPGIINNILFCGIGGGACGMCDPLFTNACNNRGQCSCGTNGPCGQGTVCVNGACVCSAKTCPMGCCDNNNTVCLPGDKAGACGVGGAACQMCGDQQECASVNGAVIGCAPCKQGAYYCPGSHTCVTSCKQDCNGLATCPLGVCTSDCLKCQGSTSLCHLMGVDSCVAGCMGTCPNGNCVP